MPDFVDTMAYAGEVPWHRLGKHVGDNNVTGAEMIAAAEMDWTVSKVPVYYDSDGNGDFKPVADQYTLVRSDTREALECTVGARYVPFQNRQLFDCMESLRSVNGDGVRFHTAGSLMGGRKVWALAQLAGEQRIRVNGHDDVSVPFILGYSAHDGSACITYRLCSTRVVCWNTLSAALGEARRPEYKVRHTLNAEDRIAEAAQVLGLAWAGIEEQTTQLQGLADTRMDVPSFVRFAAQLLTDEDDGDAALKVIAKAEGRSKAQYERKGGELTRLFLGGLGNHGASRYDALNAVTEYVDHARGRAQDWKTMDAAQLDTSVDSMLFGFGERTKVRARELLLIAA